MESFISVLGKRFSKNLHNVHLVTPRKLSTVRSLMDLKLRGVNYKLNSSGNMLLNTASIHVILKNCV